MIDRPLVSGKNIGTIICPTGSVSAIVARSWVSARIAGGGRVQLWFQKSADSDDHAPGAGPPEDWKLESATRRWIEVPSGTEYIEYEIDAEGVGTLAVEQQAK